MQEFNFNDKKRTQKVLQWIKDNYRNKISESEFVKAMEQFRKLRSYNKRSPSMRKKEYWNLRNRYGFFK